MSIETYFLYLTAVAIFFATPPDTSQLLTIANAARFGLRRARWTIAGDLTANMIQMTVAAFGLAAAIAVSAEAFLLIKWAGVAYLAWIGLGLLLRPKRSAERSAARAPSASALFRQGFLTSMANPYAVVFFGALFPQFIDPAAPIAPQLAALGGTYLLIDGATLLLWGWLGGAAARRFGSAVALNRICGALMIAAAGLLASKDLAPSR